MPYVTCPTCGERGKIPSSLIGVRIKCRKCGLSFLVSPPAGKADGAECRPAAATAGPSAAVEAHGIEVEGLDASAWAVPTEAAAAVAASRRRPSPDRPPATPAEAAPATSRPTRRRGPRVQAVDLAGQVLRREVRPGPAGGGPQPFRPPGLGRPVMVDAAPEGLSRGRSRRSIVVLLEREPPRRADPAAGPPRR